MTTPDQPAAPIERTRYVIEKKSVLPGWDKAGPGFRKLEHAMDALPYYRKDTTKDLRIVQVKTLVVHVDSIGGNHVG